MDFAEKNCKSRTIGEREGPQGRKKEVVIATSLYEGASRGMHAVATLPRIEMRGVRKCRPYISHWECLV